MSTRTPVAQVAVIAFATLVVVPNSADTARAEVQSVLDTVHAGRKRLWQFPDDDLDDGPVSANLLGTREPDGVHVLYRSNIVESCLCQAALRERRRRVDRAA